MKVLTLLMATFIGGVQARHDFVGGNNTCYTAVHWADKSAVQKLLPEGMTFPERSQLVDVMQDTTVDYDQVHPMILSFCNGTDIHDFITKKDVPQQEEIMFIFPVVYKGKYYSFIPTLFLNSWAGVIGGLFFGLKKHYKDMTINQTFDGQTTQETIHIKDLLDLKVQSGGANMVLPSYVDKTFNGEFITQSYINTIDCYTAEVNASFVHAATGELDLAWGHVNVSGAVDKVARLQYSFAMTAPYGCGAKVASESVIV